MANVLAAAAIVALSCVPLAAEAITAMGDLTFAALGAHKLYAGCPDRHEPFLELLNEAGFIEVIPAGSLDQYTQQPRQSSLPIKPARGV